MKINFGKKKERKEPKEEHDELSGVDDTAGLDEDSSGNRFSTGDTEEDSIFHDAFDAVDKPLDEGDLEDEAREFASDLDVSPTYKKAQPRFFEKTGNLIAFIGILTSVVIVMLIVFQEPIRSMVNSGSDGVEDMDIQGEVEDYREGVQDTLQTATEEREEKQKYVIDEVESIPEGEYTVGKDIEQGYWVAEDVLLEVYPDEEAKNENKTPSASNVSEVDIQKIAYLAEGQFVVVQGGELVFNDKRPETAVNVGDTVVLEDSTQYFVGKDIPEGFYTFYNLDALERDSAENLRGARIELLNAGDEENDKLGIERKSTIFLRSGLAIEINGELLAERVSSDGTYGDDRELLEDEDAQSSESE